MSVDLSKIGYGVVTAAQSTDGILISKIGYGVIVDTLHIPSTTNNFRNFMSFVP